MKEQKIIVKPILEDKFWIVEDSGVRIGTLSKDNDTYVYSSKGKVSLYANESQLTKKFGKNFLTAKIIKNNSNNSNFDVNGYTTRSNPYNSMYDISRKLPLFTKSPKSTSIYCAGYYLVKFNVNWLRSFCPKLITVERNEYIGPFKTELEMKAALSNVNRSN